MPACCGRPSFSCCKLITWSLLRCRGGHLIISGGSGAAAGKLNLQTLTSKLNEPLATHLMSLSERSPTATLQGSAVEASGGASLQVKLAKARKGSAEQRIALHRIETGSTTGCSNLTCWSRGSALEVPRRSVERRPTPSPPTPGVSLARRANPLPPPPT